MLNPMGKVGSSSNVRLSKRSSAVRCFTRGGGRVKGP